MSTEVMDEQTEAQETESKKAMALLSPIVKNKLEENNFRFSHFKSSSGFVYWIKRTVSANGAAPEVLEGAVDRMANAIVNSVNGLEAHGQTVTFKVMEKKVDDLGDGKAELGVRIKAVNYYTPGHEPKAKAPKVNYVPEFDLDGNIINAPTNESNDTTSEVSSEAANGSSSSRKR